MKLYFIRHGEPDYTTDSLTGLGRLQAEAAAKRLENEGFDELYSSPNGRAKETASYLSKRLNKPVNILDFMHEIHWGAKENRELEFNGHPWKTAKAMTNAGVDFFNPVFSREYFENSLSEAEIKKVSAGIDGFLSVQGFKREGNGYRCVKPNGKSFAVFCHGGSSTAAFSHLLNLPFLYICAVYRPEFTAISVFNFDESGKLSVPTIGIMNDSRHIDEIQTATGE